MNTNKRSQRTKNKKTRLSWKGRGVFILACLVYIYFAAVIVLDKNKVIANPGDFMQALIIASTTLMAFTGVFLSSSMFSDYRAYKDKVASTSRRFFILSIVMGLITIVFLLSWYLGWVIDPILDAKTATPKMVLVLFFGQFVTVWVGFIWKFLQKSKYA